jgi:hypothetical protein
MSIDPIHGGKPTGPTGPASISESAGTSAAGAVAEKSPVGGAQALIQTLATEVSQGRLSREEATMRFASDVVQRRFPTLSETLRQRAVAEVGRALGEDVAFQRRFERLLAGAH